MAEQIHPWPAKPQTGPADAVPFSTFMGIKGDLRDTRAKLRISRIENERLRRIVEHLARGWIALSVEKRLALQAIGLGSAEELMRRAIAADDTVFAELDAVLGNLADRLD